MATVQVPDGKKAHVEVARRLYREGMVFNMKAGLSPAVLAVKLACYEEMKALNLRGPDQRAIANPKAASDR